MNQEAQSLLGSFSQTLPSCSTHCEDKRKHLACDLYTRTKIIFRLNINNVIQYFPMLFTYEVDYFTFPICRDVMLKILPIIDKI